MALRPRSTAQSPIFRNFLAAIGICLALSACQPSSPDTSSSTANPYDLTDDQVKWMRQAARDQLDGSKVLAHDSSTWIYTPDGVGHYKALWTRDFYYMVEYAGDLIPPEDIKACIYYLLNGQRADGCIPDRVNAAGKAIYSPGAPNNPLADHAVDNGPFMAMLLCSYVRQTGDEALFRELEPQVRKGLEQIRLAANGLVYNDPDNAQCVYGFTDVVKKTGHLLFTSLLYHQAAKEMYRHCEQLGCDNGEWYRDRYKAIEQNINILWNEEAGMFWAADEGCRQIDIWGSAYAVSIGITSEAQSKSIANYLVDNYDRTILRGQVRHLPKGEYWQQTFGERAREEYQNGAYWATPLAWVIPVYDLVSPGLSRKTLENVITDFQKNGIQECINEDYAKLPNFVVSATNVYTLTK